MNISAVINTRNEAKNITRCIKNVRPYVDEIVVVDMESTDDTVKLAKELTSKVWSHKNVEYVEPARNFAIQKASGDWVILIDADEVIPNDLGQKLKELTQNPEYSYYRIPRKNVVFGKWLKHSGWWPDYQIRLFKKEAVTWDDEIHSIPITRGKGFDLHPEEKNSLLHSHYDSIEQYIDRLNRYTSLEAQLKIKNGQSFKPSQLFQKPMSEFLTRFFAWEGYKDGLHGLALSVLQAFSMFVVELKLWQDTKFRESEHVLDNDSLNFTKHSKDYKYWYYLKRSENSHDTLFKLWYKIRSKFSI